MPEDLFELHADPTAPVDPLRFADDAAAANVHRWYHEAPPFQFLRELPYNGIEAGATRIELAPDLVGIDADDPVYRLVYADNGVGMSSDQLLEFFNQLSKTGKSDARNHGIGARITTLPWNRAGLIVMSWQDGVGSMIRIRWRSTGPDRSDGHYGLHQFDVVYDDGTRGREEVVEAPDEYKPAWLNEHGTVLVCLGNTGREHTYFGPSGDPNDSIDMLAWLNRRFAALPHGVVLQVAQFNSIDPKSWPRSAADAIFGGPSANMRRRSVDGAFATFDRFTDDTTCGVVELGDDVKVRWWLMSDTVDSNGGGTAHRKDQSRRYRNGIIGVRYDHELYDVVEASAPQARHRYGTFGIIMKKVVNRVALVVEAPELAANAAAPVAGPAVRPDSARARLLVPRPSGHDELPWEEWGEQFNAHMPEAIERAIEEAEAEDQTADHSAQLRDRVRPYLKRLQSPRWRRDDDGEGTSADLSAEHTTPGAADAVTRRHRARSAAAGSAGTTEAAASRTTPDGDVVRRIRPRDPFPTPKWVSGDEFDPGRGIVWVPARNEILLNRDHRVIGELIDSLATRYVDAPGVRQRIAAHVMAYFDLDVTTKLFHVLQHRGAEHFTKSDIDHMLSDRTLTTWLYGLASAEEHLVTVVGKSLVGVKRLSA